MCRLQRAYSTCLDMAADLHQTPNATEAIEKTAFITPDGQYEYLTMAFGLTNAPSVYHRVINKALGELRDKTGLPYPLEIPRGLGHRPCK